jgi:hypothetical protein
MEATNNQEQKFDYHTLSLKKQYVWKLCKQILRDLKDGKCTEEQIDDLIASTEPRSRGYFREEDFVTADEAMKILRLGQNRNKFFDMLKVYKIESQTFKGLKIGYRREEIHKLGERLARNK